MVQCTGITFSQTSTKLPVLWLNNNSRLIMISQAYPILPPTYFLHTHIYTYIHAHTHIHAHKIHLPLHSQSIVQYKPLQISYLHEIINVTGFYHSIDTHTHIYIYIYMYMYSLIVTFPILRTVLAPATVRYTSPVQVLINVSQIKYASDATGSKFQ